MGVTANFRGRRRKYDITARVYVQNFAIWKRSDIHVFAVPRATSSESTNESRRNGRKRTRNSRSIARMGSAPVRKKTIGAE